VNLQPSALALRIAPQLPRVAAALREAKHVLVTSHASPDGDAIGSSLAMGHILQGIGIAATVYNVDRVPFNFHFLPGADGIQDTLPAHPDFDLICIVDCAHPKLLGDQFPRSLLASTKVLAIDHHRSPYPNPALMLHDPSAAAVGELLFWLACHLQIPLTLPLAECLYCALVTDTGSFRYSSTSAGALSVAAHLVAAGVDVWKVTSQVYENNPPERVALLTRVLRTLWRSPCGRLATIRITQKMLADTHADDTMCDGFINHARAIRGVEVAAQAREVEHNLHRVSFRSRGNVNVADLAASFGGGGHFNAAGCTIEGAWPTIRRHILLRLTRQLESHTDNSAHDI